jgi:predicted GNAT superfamily acetyltransferase
MPSTQPNRGDRTRMQDLRTVAEPDFAAVLALNDAQVRQTSAMDLAQLKSVARMSDYFKVVSVEGSVAAFLIALRDGAPYLNDNYAWFAARFPRFLYVDRVVVDAAFAGRGLGRALYEDLFAHARAQTIGTIVCEYNIDPPNPASRAFHDRFGFREIGTQWVAGGSKQVSMQVAAI